jgi:peptidoglycan/LPS O-acetylase OafA/YrhL
VSKLIAYPPATEASSTGLEPLRQARPAAGTASQPGAEPRPRPAKGLRIPELDGLRGMAISLVIAYHYFDFSPPAGYRPASLLSRLYVYFERCIAVGWSGVDLFFVLSGFLIGGILLDARQSPRYFRTFYMRRFFRIIPIYYVWTAAFLLTALLLGWASASLAPARQFGWGMIPVQLLFLQNIGFVTYGVLARPWFSPTWSLAVEEQFYLVSPLLVRWLSRKTLYAVLVTVVVAAPLFRLWARTANFSFMNDLGWAYTMMPSRADGLCIGILAALLWKDARVRSWLQQNAGAIRIAAVAFAAGVVFLALWSPDFKTLPMQSVGFTWMALFYSLLLLLVLANPAGMLGSIARVHILREIGKVSYCLYLIHQVVGVAVQAALQRIVGTPRPAQAITAYAFAALAAYGIAQLSWKYLERPLLERGHSVTF